MSEEKFTRILQDTDRALHTEWLETNSLGDYASGTICGCNARRYHSLLTANLAHYGRHVLLSTLEDWLDADGTSYPLSARKHPGCFYPEGVKTIQSWSPSPCPTFTYKAGRYTVTRQLMLLDDKHCTVVRYALACDDPAADWPVTLRISPQIAYRPHHYLTHANMDLQVKTFPAKSGFKTQPYNQMPPYFMQVEGDFVFLPSPEWIYNVEYPIEAERGFSCSEDIFSAGIFEIHLKPGQECFLSFSTEELTTRGDATLLSSRWNKELARRSAKPATLRDYLAKEGQAFLTTSPGGGSVVLAGYHWFDSWGRDTLISLPGTAFLAGRRSKGSSALRRLMKSISDGLIPNTFDSDGHASGYNSIDASLWFAWALQQLLDSYSHSTKGLSTKRDEMCKVYGPAVNGIILAFRQGHIPFVRVDHDGLLEVGTRQTQLTWMDAQVNGSPVTPRNGYPVELQALWYNTLAFARETTLRLNELNGTNETPLVSEAELSTMRDAFARHFVRPCGGLCDVWRPYDEGGPDTRVRPNQLIAVSMPYSILNPRYWHGVVETVRRELLTPFGLRTLSPSDTDYCPSYGGAPEQRDKAYHQGTVWPWLLGPYADALFRSVRSTASSNAAERKKEMAEAASSFLETISPLFTRHLAEAGVGHISEIFSAEPPYAPDGCIAQAWSTGEVLRALITTRREAPEAYDAWEQNLDWRLC